MIFHFSGSSLPPSNLLNPPNLLVTVQVVEPILQTSSPDSQNFNPSGTCATQIPGSTSASGSTHFSPSHS